MNTLFIGQKIIRLKLTDSTNSHLSLLTAQEKLPEGTVIVTQKQEKGRGQRGTSWESEQGKNLTLSILLHPTFLKPEEQFLISKTVAVAMAEFVKMKTSNHSKEDNIKVKWPNDIYIGNRKVAGMLIENVMNGNSLNHSIVGIGINVNQEIFSKELPNPTSFKVVTGKYFDLDECLPQLFSCVESRYLKLKSNHFKEINEEYLKNLYRFKVWANYNFKGENIKAKIIGVSKIGKLVLEKENEESLECDFKEIIIL